MHEKDSLQGFINKTLKIEGLPKRHVFPPYFTTGVITTALSGYDVANGDMRGIVINAGLAIVSFGKFSLDKYTQRVIDYRSGVEVGKRNVFDAKKDSDPQDQEAKV
ncbi:MAG: hypothetical protein ACRDFB_03040 [Rhabdochlamydiaceae bacterium]